jgi:hypothetical protein
MMRLGVPAREMRSDGRTLFRVALIGLAVAGASMALLEWRIARSDRPGGSEVNAPEAEKALPQQIDVPRASLAPLESRTGARGPYFGPTHERYDEKDTKDPAPGPNESAKAQAERALVDLERSGSPSGAWTSNAWQILERWRAAAPQHVDLSEFRCFGSGCSVTATYGDIQTFNAERLRPQADGELAPWQGARFQSGPIRTSSGSVESIWILYRPIKELPAHEEKP